MQVISVSLSVLWLDSVLVHSRSDFPFWIAYCSNWIQIDFQRFFTRTLYWFRNYYFLCLKANNRHAMPNTAMFKFWPTEDDPLKPCYIGKVYPVFSANFSGHESEFASVHKYCTFVSCCYQEYSICVAATGRTLNLKTIWSITDSIRSIANNATSRLETWYCIVYIGKDYRQ